VAQFLVVRPHYALMPKHIKSGKEIHVGDFYEDCAFHPCLCISVGADKHDPDGLEGISLVNGGVRCCSAEHCGVRLLTVKEAIHWKLHGPADEKLDAKERWWKE
jgi:hypothetical protein